MGGGIVCRMAEAVAYVCTCPSLRASSHTSVPHSLSDLVPHFFGRSHLQGGSHNVERTSWTLFPARPWSKPCARSYSIIARGRKLRMYARRCVAVVLPRL
jgi:hypothetical protein